MSETGKIQRRARREVPVITNEATGVKKMAYNFPLNTSREYEDLVWEISSRKPRTFFFSGIMGGTTKNKGKPMTFPVRGSLQVCIKTGHYMQSETLKISVVKPEHYKFPTEEDDLFKKLQNLNNNIVRETDNMLRQSISEKYDLCEIVHGNMSIVAKDFRKDAKFNTEMKAYIAGHNIDRKRALYALFYNYDDEQGPTNIRITPRTIKYTKSNGKIYSEVGYSIWSVKDPIGWTFMHTPDSVIPKEHDDDELADVSLLDDVTIDFQSIKDASEDDGGDMESFMDDEE